MIELQQIAIAFLVSAGVTALAFWRGWLSESGAVGALIVGTLTMGLGGWVWGILLGVFFVSSSVLSKFKAAEKKKAAEKFDKGHRRDIMQAFANGGLGALVALISAFFVSDLWFPFFIGIMATVTADTWATELGTLSQRPPRLITTGRTVDVGTSGGISVLGTAVSFIGGAMIGVVAGLLSSDIGWWQALLVGGAGGLAGSLWDSLLGATVQQIYYCDTCEKDTEKKIHGCGTETRPLRGWAWLNNDIVNLWASAMGGIVAVLVLLILT